MVDERKWLELSEEERIKKGVEMTQKFIKARTGKNDWDKVGVLNDGGNNDQ